MNTNQYYQIYHSRNNKHDAKSCSSHRDKQITRNNQQ